MIRTPIRALQSAPRWIRRHPKQAGLTAGLAGLGGLFGTLAASLQKARPYQLEQAIAALPSQVAAITRHGVQTLHTQKPRIEAIVNTALFLKSGGVNPQALSQSVEAAEMATNMWQRGARIEQVVKQNIAPWAQTVHRAPKL